MGHVTFEVRDFFDWEVTEQDQFDLIYDYTYVHFDYHLS
jgi:hypothetical protein